MKFNLLFGRSAMSIAVLGLCLLAGQAMAASTTTTSTINETYGVSNVTKSVTTGVVGGIVTTTTKTTQTLVFKDPNVWNGSDEVSSLSFNTKSAGKLTVTANGENGNSATQSKTKLVVASNLLGTIGLGVDSCNRNFLGIEVNSGGQCGYDKDVDAFKIGNGLFGPWGGESITFSFDKTVTLESAIIADAFLGSNTFAVSVDGSSTLQSFKMGALGIWRQTDLSKLLSGKTFTFFAYDPKGMKWYDDFYITGLTFSTTSTVPEPQSLALVLAGLAVVGGLSRRRVAARQA